MNFLVNRSDAIGDTLLTLPLAQAIKKIEPNAKVHFVVSAKSAELLENHPYVDQVFVLDSKDFFIKKFKKLKSYFLNNKIEKYLHVGGSHLPSFVAWYLGLDFRGGLLTKWPSFLWLNKGLRQKRSKVQMHELEYNLSLLEPLVAHKLDFDNIDFRINVGSSLKRAKPYIVIHPGMVGHSLNWPAVMYAHYVAKMYDKEHPRYEFIISFTPADELYISEFQDECQKINPQMNLIYLDGAKQGLKNYSRLLSGADLFVGGSTGPTHIANALGIKQISFYSPIPVQSVNRWGPWKKDQSISFTPDVVCPEKFYCAGQSCPYYECMGKISVDEVVGKSLELLSGETNASN